MMWYSISMSSIIFNADKLTLRGPTVDGSYNITFSTGEYEKNNVAELLKLPNDVTLQVTVKTND